MPALVALLCLYMGGNNVKKAFVLAPFGSWTFINWALLVTGVAMLALVYPLVKKAINDYNAAKEDAYAQLQRQEEAKKRKYQLDNDEDFDSQE